MSHRIGLFGGTFDPPHIGHTLCASLACDELGLESVQMMVAGDPWQKSAATQVTAASVRLAMTTAACRGSRRLIPSDAELHRSGPSYTIDTVDELKRSGVESITLILGADAAAGLDSWNRARELAEMVELAVMRRPGVQQVDLGSWWSSRVIEIPQIELSSTMIRRRVEAGQSVEFLVAPEVESMIHHLGLYRGSR